MKLTEWEYHYLTRYIRLRLGDAVPEEFRGMYSAEHLAYLDENYALKSRLYTKLVAAHDELVQE
jgi:hypothetical protein